MPMFRLPGMSRSADPSLDELTKLFLNYKASKAQQQPEQQPVAAPQSPRNDSNEGMGSPEVDSLATAMQTPQAKPPRKPAQNVDDFLGKRTVTKESVQRKGPTIITNQGRTESLSVEAKAKIDQVNKYYNNKLYRMDADRGLGAMSQEDFDAKRAALEAEREAQIAKLTDLDRVMVNKRTTVKAAGDAYLPSGDPTGPRFHGEPPRSAAVAETDDGFGPRTDTTIELGDNDVYNKATGGIQTPEEAERWGFNRVGEANERAAQRGSGPIYDPTSKRQQAELQAQRDASNPYGLPAVPVPEPGEDQRTFQGRYEQWKQNLQIAMSEAKTSQEIAQIAAEAAAKVAELRQSGANTAEAARIAAQARRDVAQIAADAKVSVADRALDASKYKADKTAAKPAINPKHKVIESLRSKYAQYQQEYNEVPDLSTIKPDESYAQADTVQQQLVTALMDGAQAGRNLKSILAAFKAKYPKIWPALEAGVLSDPDIKGILDGAKPMSFAEYLKQSGLAAAYDLTDADLTEYFQPQTTTPATTAEYGTGAYEEAGAATPAQQPRTVAPAAAPADDPNDPVPVQSDYKPDGSGLITGAHVHAYHTAIAKWAREHDMSTDEAYRLSEERDRATPAQRQAPAAHAEESVPPEAQELIDFIDQLLGSVEEGEELLGE